MESGTRREVAAAEPLADDPVAGGAQNTTATALVAGGLWSTAARVIPQLYTLVILVAAAHYLGPSRLGQQSYIAFVELSVIMLATAGMPTAVMRHVGESLGAGRAGGVRRLIATAWLIELVAAAVGGGAMVIAAFVGASPSSAWALAGIAAALGVMHTVPSALLIGAQQWRAASVVGLITGTIGAPATIVALALGGGITSMFAVEAAVALANLVGTTVLARRVEVTFPKVPPGGDDLRRRTFRYAAFASIGVVLSFVVWRRSEFFFLKEYSTYKQIALYSIPFSFIAALVRLFEAVIAVVTPAVATLHGAELPDRIRSGYGRALRLLTVSSVLLSAALIPIGPELLQLLGNAYRGTGTVTLIMLIAFPIVPLAKVAQGVLHGFGHIRAVLVAGTIAAVCNVVLDILIIPGNGAIGAAVANAGAQTIAGVAALYLSIRVAGGVDWHPIFLLRSFVVAAAVCAAAWAGVHVGGHGLTGVVVGFAFAAAVFLVAAPIIRFLPPDDATWLEGLAGPRFGGIPARALRACAP